VENQHANHIISEPEIAQLFTAADSIVAPISISYSKYVRIHIFLVLIIDEKLLYIEFNKTNKFWKAFISRWVSGFNQGNLTLVG
jgi:hypothetical protein